MKMMNKTAKILTRILEVAHWVAVGLMAAAAICSVAAPQWVDRFVGIEVTGNSAELSLYGLTVTAAVSEGRTDRTTFLLFAAGAVAILTLMAMIFRNLHLIIRKAEESTPFQEDNVRRLKEIGIFSMAIPVVGLAVSVITRLALGPDTAEISMNMYGFFMGVIVLCLTQFFIHGVELEHDVDGLL